MLAKSSEGMIEWFERSDKMDLAMADALNEIFPELKLEMPDDRPYLLRSKYEDLIAERLPEPELPKKKKKGWFRHGKKR